MAENIIEKILDMYVVEKYSSTFIAKELNISISKVLKILNENNIQRKHNGTWNKGLNKTLDSRISGGRKSKGVFFCESTGYLHIWINGKSIRYHRFLWEQVNGTIPKGYVLHHIDGDKLNNNLQNLELLKNSEHTKLHHKQQDIHMRIKK